MYRALAYSCAYSCAAGAILGLLSQQWICAFGLVLAASHWWRKARDAEIIEAIFADDPALPAAVDHDDWRAREGVPD